MFNTLGKGGGANRREGGREIRNVKDLSNRGGSINWMGEKIMVKGPRGLSKKNRILNWGNAHESEREM